MKTVVIAAACCSVLAAAALTITWSVGALSGTNGAPEWLAGIAYRVATENGDPDRTSAEWMLATMEQGGPAMGASPEEYVIPMDSKRYFVVLRGDFVAEGWPRPQGADTPTGSCIVVEVNPVTQDIEGMAIWPYDVRVDTSSLDQLKALPLAPE
jgi:hypothetical protein